ncbi:MAG: helix-turn-helix domain-containing protein [Roseburia sp.]|nr:helix-turn-helix domain-containing protein [Roseburia sp.]
MKFSEKLRQLRSEGGYTLKVVAEGIGIPISTYSNYEQGIREPSLDIVVRICNFYGVSADFLLGREGD